jgi:serpin B
MKISKIAFASLCTLSLMITTSCNEDDNDEPPTPNNSKVQKQSSSSENNGNEQTTPSDYTLQNEEALKSASIATKAAIENDYDMWQSVYSDEFADFARKVTAFSNKMAIAIGAKQDENTAVSPISIFMALSMATECADGDTRQELLDAMGITYDELNANIRPLCYVCNQVLCSSESASNKDCNLIKCVNSLWLQDGLNVKDNGINALTTKYYADLFKMDFENSDVNELITSYISNETNGFLRPDLQITPEVVMILMNVVYLRESWKDFGEELEFTNNKYNFTSYDNTTKSIKLLQGCYYEKGKVVETEKFRKFYTTTNSGLTLTFFVPKDGYTLDDIYTTDVLNDNTPYVYTDEDSNPNVKYRFHTRCLFPEYKAEYDNNIADVISQLGVQKFFSSSQCDFSHLTDDNVCCGIIRHIAKLEVTSKGIEGAAVTAEMMFGSNIDEEVWEDVLEDFVVDRNFAYILSKDDVPIFTGAVKTVE